jgi:hypothetical protein
MELDLTAIIGGLIGGVGGGSFLTLVGNKVFELVSMTAQRRRAHRESQLEKIQKWAPTYPSQSASLSS